MHFRMKEVRRVLKMVKNRTLFASSNVSIAHSIQLCENETSPIQDNKEYQVSSMELVV